MHHTTDTHPRYSRSAHYGCIALVMVGWLGCSRPQEVEQDQHAPAWFSGSHDKPTLSEQEYLDLWTEVMLLQQHFDTNSDAALIAQARDSLMKANGHSWEDFKQSHWLYERDATGQMARVDSIQARLRQEIQQVSLYIRQMESEADTSGSADNIE